MTKIRDMEHILIQFEKMYVVPMVAIADAADVPKLGAALTEGGLPEAALGGLWPSCETAT